MLKITVLGIEHFNEQSQEFFTEGDFEIELEHSLASLSKWEQKWEKPFLGKDEKSPEELFSYLKCMILTPDVPAEVLNRLSEQNIKDVNEYMNAKMTGTWFHETPGSSRPSTKVLTNELIYYWMTQLSIPFECQYWHLNRLFTLLKIHNVENTKPKKGNTSDILAQRAKLNEERRKMLNTTG